MPPHGRVARRILQLTMLVALALLVLACTKDRVTAPSPVNHAPVISSMWSFPEVLGSQDSMIVACLASDADGDTLFYDWITDAHFVIKGNPPDNHHLYDSRSNTQVFIRDYVLPTDTVAWVQCIVRDHKGGADGRVLVVRVHP